MSKQGYRQDMPPEGGYRAFNWERTYARALMRPKVVIPTITFIAGFGVYESWAYRRQLATRKLEDTELHTCMQPFLKAERDRRWLRVLKKNRELEDEIMKDVPGWQTGTWYGEPVYYTLGDKWWDPEQLEFHAHSPAKLRSDEILWRQHSDYSAPKFYDKWIPEFLKPYFW